MCADGAFAIAANFVNKFAMLLLPDSINSVLLLQLLAMMLTMSAAKTAGLVSFPPFSTCRLAYLFYLSTSLSQKACHAPFFDQYLLF